MAAELGGTVIVLEKLAIFGGNTGTAGGNYAAVDPERQANTGGLGGDSIKIHAEDIHRGGDYKGSYELAYALASNALDGIEWLEGLGMEFVDTVYLVNGSSVPRTHSNIESHGSYMIKALLEAAEANPNITLYAETPGAELIVTDGRVTGVKATAADGSEVEFTANKGVIMATGGYYGTNELAMEYSDAVHPETRPYGITTNVGDGLIMGREIGAQLVNMDIVQFSGFNGTPAGWQGGLNAVISVNAEGERFAKETAYLDKDFTVPLSEQTGAYAHTVFDQAAVNANEANAAVVEAALATGEWFKADTLEELAGLMGVPAEGLEKAVASYNEGYATGIDEFGRAVFATPMTTAPFYGSAPQYPQLRYSVGGLSINDECEVLDADNEPIPGLYAAGECSGPLFGTYRMSSHAIAAVTVFGRIAAESAMTQVIE